MDEDFVADSEDEGQLRLSASISPRRALESAFSRDITNNIDTPLPPAKSFASSVISQFTSTVASTGQGFDDSPIIQFSTAETRPSTSKAKKPKRLQEVIDLSDDDGDFSPIANKSRRKKSVDAEPKPRKTKPRARNRDSSQSGKDRAQSTDIERVSSEPLESIPITDESDIPETKTGKGQKKKPAKTRKKDQDAAFDTIEISSAASEKQDSPPPSRKRKAVDSESAKPTKRRKKTPPQELDTDQEDKPKKGKGSRKGREKKPAPVDDGEESAPDELLLASEDESKVQSMPSKRTRKPPSKASTVQSTKESPPPRSKSPETEPPEEDAQVEEPEAEPAQPPPPPAIKPKPNPRPSVVQQNPHVIPKRGSISSLLMKTGAYAPLSSSKLTKRVSSKIAPLHLERKTPPPPPPPIPKPKKKAKDEEEDEEDFTGMTEKQIARYKEEKKKKAWYSP